MDTFSYFPGKPELPQNIAPANAPVTEEPPYTPGDARRACSRVGLGLVAMLAADLLLSAIFVAVSYLFTPAPSMDLLMIISSVVLYAMAIPIFYLTVMGLPKTRAEGAGCSLPRALCYFLLCLPILYLLSFLGEFVSKWISKLTGLSVSNALETSVDGMSLLLIFLATVVAAPIFEELVFRRFILDRVGGFGALPACALSGLCFGLYHGNFYQFFYAFAIGCFFAYVYLSTGKLRYSIGLHMAVNFFGAFLPTWITRTWGEESMAAGVFSTAILLAAVTGGILWIVFLVGKRFPKVKEPRRIPAGKESAFFLCGGMILFYLFIAGYFLLNMTA